MQKSERRIYVTQGLPGSGEMEWAKNWCSENPNDRVVINTNVAYNNSLSYIIESYMNDYADIVLCSSGFDNALFNHVKEMVAEFNHMDSFYHYKVERKIFVMPLEFYIKKHPHNENVIRELYSKHRDLIETCLFNSNNSN